MEKKVKRTKRTSTPSTRWKRSTKRRKPSKIFVRRSSGRKEKFDASRMAQTTSRSGVPFMMARDIATRVSKKIKLEGKGTTKTVTAGRMRKMITKELRDRNQHAIASAYGGDSVPDYIPEKRLTDLRKPTIGSADTDQHSAYRADRDSVLHDRSKRLSSL